MIYLDSKTQKKLIIALHPSRMFNKEDYKIDKHTICQLSQNMIIKIILGKHNSREDYLQICHYLNKDKQCCQKTPLIKLGIQYNKMKLNSLFMKIEICVLRIKVLLKALEVIQEATQF